MDVVARAQEACNLYSREPRNHRRELRNRPCNGRPNPSLRSANLGNEEKEIRLRCGADELWQSFEDYDGLVSARNDSFGNGDQLILLTEHPQPGWLRFAAI